MTQKPLPNGSLQNATGLGPCVPELALDRAAFCEHPGQHRIEVGDMEVQVDRRPVSLVAAHLGTTG